jgi:GGDEF domain-containing protein
VAIFAMFACDLVHGSTIWLHELYIFLGRLGGDEFVILMPSTPEADALGRAQPCQQSSREK